MLDEIYDSIDDGLDNYKVLIIQKAQKDSTVFNKTVFDESNYFVREVDSKKALNIHERYSDTLMYMENEKKLEPVRLLTTVFSQDNKYYELRVISSMVEEDDLIEDLLYYIIILYIVIMVSVIIINNILLKKIWQPFYELITKLKAFNLKKNAVFSTPKTNVQEFVQLNETVLTLLNKNIEVYSSQKQFIENAAHELQTPLAISINKLELILEEQLSDEKGAQALSEIINNLERLTRLNKSLLLLSKIENEQFNEAEQVNMNSLINKLREDFKELMEFKNLHLSIQENAVFSCLINKDLALVLLTNLIKNAIAHNVPNGEIKILIDRDKIEITNSGKKEPMDKDKIFKRFYKVSETNSSTGLGLAIAKAICDLYHLKVSYHYNDGHTIILSN
jgi:signal transduction histidine kinase